MQTKILFSSVVFILCLLLQSCNLNDFANNGSLDNSGLSTKEKIVLGLKTALKLGIDSSALSASNLNGYLANKAIKILLPEEASQALASAQIVGDYVKPFKAQLEIIQSVVNLTPGLNQSAFTTNLNKSSSLIKELDGLSTLSDSLVLYMNRAAEYAAPRSIPIFKSVITDMTINDGLTLLNSSDSTAATFYLNNKTNQPLITAYSPIVDSTLMRVPLTQYWSEFRSTYNLALSKYNELYAFQQSWNSNSIVKGISTLQVNKLKPLGYSTIETESLGTWTTNKALGGLFYLVGQEETKIRRDPFGFVKSLASDVADLLSEVFGKIMKMEKA